MATQKAFGPKMTTDENEVDLNVYTHLSKLIITGETHYEAKLCTG